VDNLYSSLTRHCQAETLRGVTLNIYQSTSVSFGAGRAPASREVLDRRKSGDTERCFSWLLERHPVHPCSFVRATLSHAVFTAVTRVQTSSGTPNLTAKSSRPCRAWHTARIAAEGIRGASLDVVSDVALRFQRALHLVKQYPG